MNGDEHNITLNELLKEIVKNRQEIKNFIEASETRALLKIEELKSKVYSLEKENHSLRNKIESLERVTKKNNILIFGLHRSNKDLLSEIVTQELNKYLGVDLVEQDINNIYVINKSNDSPIKVEFVSYLRKLQVLKNCYKLKGTDITIAHDQTLIQRQEDKILRRHLSLAKQEGHKNCYIRKNKLYINDEEYTPQQLQQTEELQEENIYKSNSAPPTPSRSSQQKVQPQPSSHQQINSVVHMPLESEEDQPKVAEVKGKKVPANKNSAKQSRILRSVISSSQS